jgi:ketosteroid isomerase-like protein
MRRKSAAMRDGWADTARAMSEETVNVVRRSFDLFLAGDVEGWLETIHPEVGWDISAHPLPDVLNEGHGATALVEMFGTYMSGWSDYEAELTELADVGSDQVLAVIHETARMRKTDVLLERDLIQLWNVRDGRGAFLRVFKTKQEALEAAGLSDQRPAS